jgi:deoxyribose-phosphate aldolase
MPVRDGVKSVAVDGVMLEALAAGFTRRSLKQGAKMDWLRLAVRMMDLTTLEGADTPGRVARLCRKARRPMPERYGCPPVAAVCVYGDMVAVAKEELAGSGVRVAAVATAFPSGRASLDVKLADVAYAVEQGADEIDMVIDRGAFLRGDHGRVRDEIGLVRQACGGAHLKVILETGELSTYDNVRRASDLAIAAGAHFIKTSTGKISPAATMPVTLVMLEAIRDHHRATGQKVGMKPAGGIRTAKQALHYLVMVRETLGEGWLDPELFRFGASSLLGDVEMQIAKMLDGGRYQDPEGFSLP